MANITEEKKKNLEELFKVAGSLDADSKNLVKQVGYLMMLINSVKGNEAK